MRLILVAALSFAFAWLLCYGAMKTAQAIARNQTQQIESIDQ